MNVKTIKGFAHIECLKGLSYENAPLWDYCVLFAPKTADFAASVSKCAHKSRVEVLSPHSAL